MNAPPGSTAYILGNKFQTTRTLQHQFCHMFLKLQFI